MTEGLLSEFDLANEDTALRSLPSQRRREANVTPQFLLRLLAFLLVLCRTYYINGMGLEQDIALRNQAQVHDPPRPLWHPFSNPHYTGSHQEHNLVDAAHLVLYACDESDIRPKHWVLGWNFDSRAYVAARAAKLRHEDAVQRRVRDAEAAQRLVEEAAARDVKK